MLSLLERRRREARAHDEIQRQAEERAAKARQTPGPRRQLPAPIAREPLSNDDQLASLLVRDGRQLATTADLLPIFEHFEKRIDELEAQLGEQDDD